MIDIIIGNERYQRAWGRSCALFELGARLAGWCRSFVVDRLILRHVRQRGGGIFRTSQYIYIYFFFLFSCLSSSRDAFSYCPYCTCMATGWKVGSGDSTGALGKFLFLGSIYSGARVVSSARVSYRHWKAGGRLCYSCYSRWGLYR